MKRKASIESRKDDHIRINLEEDVTSGLSTGLEQYRFVHEALPDLNVDQIDLSQNLFGKTLQFPILISSMTGGTSHGLMINTILAQAAQEFRLAMGVGSQRIALERNQTRNSFQIRRIAPTALLFANLGAVQLNFGLSVDDCQKVVDMIEADALILHLNPIQEALQEGGNTDFKGLLKKIENVCRSLEVPVIVKEVGWGISAETAIRLVNAGVQVIDVAGAGGTSWSQVEKFRMSDDNRRFVAEAFRTWGIPTAESIVQIHETLPQIPIFASGGLKNGIDILKCIALGAKLGGMAGKFLQAAAEGENQVLNLAEILIQQMKICMFGIGVENLNGIVGSKKLVKYPE